MFKNRLTAQERWLRRGYKKGWISEAFCMFHETPEFTDEENWEIDEYNETCVPCVRVFIEGEN